MTKQELLENYTMEQLADKIIALEIAISDMKNTEKIIKQYNSKQCDCENVGVIIKCLDCGKSNIFELDEKSSQLIQGKLTDKVNCLNNESRKLYGEIYDLKAELDAKKNTINQIDDILNELFGVTHDIVSKPDEFKEILKEKIESSKTIADFLPTEPIKVADMLINASKKRINCMTEKEYDKYVFEKWQLLQIAEHLLVYCNANGEGEE